MSRFIALFIFIALGNAFGQGLLIGSTYGPSNSSISEQGIIAPGQVATLQVIGLKTVLSQPITANTIPLPTVLAGISVTIEQQVIAQVTSLPVPLISVAPAGSITLITVEIPVETVPFLFASHWPLSQLVISESGGDSQSFAIVPRPANTHVTGCRGNSGTCVTHADGSVVTAKSPAKAGETIVIYAYGLGQTNPAVPSGTVTPIPAPVAANAIYVAFNFTPNAGLRYPFVDPKKQGPVNVPAFAGLTPGQIGLYQINVKLPDNFPAMSACSSNYSPYYSAIQSNLTIDITTYFYDYGSLSDAAAPSFDAAPICVQPPPTQ